MAVRAEMAVHINETWQQRRLTEVHQPPAFRDRRVRRFHTGDPPILDEHSRAARQEAFAVEGTRDADHPACHLHGDLLRRSYR